MTYYTSKNQSWPSPCIKLKTWRSRGLKCPWWFPWCCWCCNAVLGSKLGSNFLLQPWRNEISCPRFRKGNFAAICKFIVYDFLTVWFCWHWGWVRQRRGARISGLKGQGAVVWLGWCVLMDGAGYRDILGRPGCEWLETRASKATLKENVQWINQQVIWCKIYI